MTRPECPLPQVEDALTPYINTREKTTRIRQILTEHTRRQVKVQTELSHLSLTIAPSSLEVTGGTSASNGLYHQYLLALKAHQQARERYDVVKGELDQMLQSPQPAVDGGRISSANSAREYASILRQRRHLRKLEIVQDALTKLSDAESNPSVLDIKFAVREEIGDPPQAPIASSSDGIADGGSSDRVQELTFQLKKELLLAKNKFAEAKDAKEEAQQEHANGSSTDTSEAVSILRDARDELISWVEGELGKIPEDEVEASQVEMSFLGGDEDDYEQNGHPLSNEELSARVEQLYDQYLRARQRYISEVESALDREARLRETSNAQSGADANLTRRNTLSHPSQAAPSTITAATILPSLTSLNSAQHTNAQMQSQTAHLRRQLNLASSDTQTLIQRLAGESLLVPQDSSSVAAWSKAAQDASEKTKGIVMANVIEGEASVAMAKKVLDGLRARRQGLESLRRDL